MRLTSLVLVVALAGCSAGRAAVAMVQADRSIAHAKSRGAGDQAAYELRMAEAYLTKAREEAHFSSYRTSVELARGAADWADKAIIQMEEQGTASARSNPDAPGGVEGDPEQRLPSQGTGTDATPPRPDPPPPPPKKDPWTPPGAETPPAEPAQPAAPGTDSEEPPPAPKLIVVPAPAKPETQSPEVIIVPRDPEPQDDDHDDAEDSP